MSEWQKLDVVGPACEINREGVVRQKEKPVLGGVERDVARKGYHGHKGRLYMVFRDSGHQQIKYLHVLLAESFVPNPDKLKHVLAKDGDYMNLGADNFKWVSAAGMPKISNPMAKLSETDIEEIAEHLDLGILKQCEIARKYGVSESRISRLKK